MKRIHIGEEKANDQWMKETRDYKEEKEGDQDG